MMKRNDKKLNLPSHFLNIREINKKLRSGYLEMAEFNANYAEMCLEADNETLASCEEKLSESE